MRLRTLAASGLRYYWRTNLAVIAGVATAVAVLGGALLVGESVRASLRDLALERLGRTADVVSFTGFFREQLAAAFPDACLLIVTEGMVTHEPSGRRAAGVAVYGVDERFWKFHHGGSALGPREIALSPALMKELASSAGDAILLRVEKPSAIPIESLHGRKEDPGRTIRLAMRPASSLAEFSLRPQQGEVRAAFVPLARLQRDLGLEGRVNTILVARERQSDGASERVIRASFTLEDLGLKIRPVRGGVSVETASAILSDRLAAVILANAGVASEPLLSYLANSIRAGDRQVAYSVVTARGSGSGIDLNEWAARELRARPGDTVTLEYYVWKEPGRLVTETAQFRVTSIVPVSTGDPDFVPEYPGITEAKSLHDWAPPFPMDLSRIRPADEDYWNRYRATPKAFVPLEAGQKLWGSRFGKLTSIRVATAGANGLRLRLRAALDPLQFGFSVTDARAQALAASRGATDFGEYFVYFSFFLVVSALLLAGLFFQLGVEQRHREIGTLHALGFAARDVRRLFVIEASVLAVAGAALGAVAAAGYAALVLYGLRTWWAGAVGASLLRLHVAPGPLIEGAAGGCASALVFLVASLRRIRTVSPRALIAGARRPAGRRAVYLGAACLVLAVLLLAGANRIGQSGAFFGAGSLLLVAALAFEWRWLSRGGARFHSVAGLGLRNASYRPARSMLAIALIASACFIVVSVGVFRKDAGGPEAGGGYPLMATSVLPIAFDLNSARDLSLPPARFVQFRVRPGDDASCLNLYEPRSPRVLGAPEDFLRSARFRFRDSLTRTPEEHANPWLLLLGGGTGDAVPAIADANSLEYVLHRKLGDEVVVDGRRLRVVAALDDSIFQGELIISAHDFVRVFPEQEGFRFFLIDAPVNSAGSLEQALSDFGFDASETSERLAAFHRVENTYIATFQSLGALGLLLGTVGMAAVLLRNVLERRREMAMLRAAGYRSDHFLRMVLAENLLLLAAGLLTGGVCAVAAIAPAVFARGGRFPGVAVAAVLLAMLATGLLSSLIATRAALRGPLVAALRAE